MNQVKLRFLRDTKIAKAGEVIIFSKKKADQLLENGVAEEVGNEQKEPSVPFREVLKKYLRDKHQDDSDGNMLVLWELYRQNKTPELTEWIRQGGALTVQPLRVRHDQSPTIKRHQIEALEYLADKKINDSTEQVVKAVLAKWRIATIRDDKGHSEVYVYDDGIYLPNGLSYIAEMTRATYGKSFTGGLLSQIQLKVMTDTYVSSDNFFNGAPPRYIALLDCLYDLEEHTTTPFNPEIIFLRKLPVNYDPQADCPAIKEFLTTILANEEDLETMQEVFGYFLYREYWLEKSVMMLGKGSNGKTVLLELMRAFLGETNVSSISLEEIQKDQYAVANLLGKLANIAGDIGNQPIENSQTFKKLTGRDPLTANRKHLPHVEFKNYAKLIFSCNELPDSFDDTDGFWRRWIFFNFPRRFVRREEYESFSNYAKKDLGIADPFILQKITTQEELNGLFLWALEGLKRLRARKSFSDKKTASELRELWKKKANSFFAFLEDEVEICVGRCIRETNLMQAYTNYCRKNGMAPTSEKSIKYQLRKFGANYQRKMLNPPPDSPYERDYFWTGIIFKQDEQKGVESLYKEKVLEKDEEKTQTKITTISRIFPAGEFTKQNIPERVVISDSELKDCVLPQSKGQQGKERWTMTDLIYKCLKALNRKNNEPVTFESLLETSRQQATTLGILRVSSDVFENQFEEAVNFLLKKGEILEAKPGKYVPL